jgi:glycosyltransferase involved in cell wall biosynthesis
MDICIVCACNDERILESTLLASPGLTHGIELSIQKGMKSAALAYNRGIDETKSEIIILVHQDVYLPPGWMSRLQNNLDILTFTDPNWGALGIFGMHENGAGIGWVFSTGLGRVVGAPFTGILRVRVLDELLLIIRRSSGLRFDQELPGFHMYGTDICLQAEAKGMRNYVIPAFAIHNSNGVKRLPYQFWQACWHVLRKHQKVLPVRTPCIYLPKSRWGLLLRFIKHYAWDGFRRELGHGRVAAPELLYWNLVKRKLAPVFQ